MNKQSTIIQILHGTYPNPETFDFGQEIEDRLVDLCQNETILLKNLKDTPEYDFFVKYRDAFNDIESIENEVFYKEGLRMGFNLAMDIFEC